MNPREIAIKDGATIAWQCTKCECIYELRRFTDEALSKATRCCGPNTCETCGQPTQPHWTACNACLAAKEEARELARFEAATKVTFAEYQGSYLYIEGFGNEGYIDRDEIEEVLEAIEPSVRPKWAWACEPQTASLDLTDTIEDYALEEMHESARELVDWKIVEEAQKLVDKALEDVVSNFCDNTTAVLLPEVAPTKENTP